MQFGSATNLSGFHNLQILAFDANGMSTSLAFLFEVILENRISTIPSVRLSTFSHSLFLQASDWNAIDKISSYSQTDVKNWLSPVSGFESADGF
jgi:hypothetical protein